MMKRLTRSTMLSYGPWNWNSLVAETISACVPQVEPVGFEPTTSGS